MEEPVRRELPTKEVGEFREKDNHDQLLPIDTLFEGLDQEEIEKRQVGIYEDYARSMTRAGKESLEEERFYYHFFEESVAFGSEKNGYLLGSRFGGVFFPTHFCPRGIREGAEIINNLFESNTPTVFFITDDLVKTARRLKGWKILPFKIKSDFRGEVVTKTMIVNNWEALVKLAPVYLERSYKKAKNEVRGRTRDLRWKTSRLWRKVNKIRNANKEVKDSIELVEEDLASSLLSEWQ